MFDFIRIAAAVPNVKVADVEYNKAKIIEKIEEAEAEGVSIIAFPELAVTSYSCGDLFFQESLIAASENAVYEIAEQTKDIDIFIVLGAPVKLDYQLFNAAIILYHGELKGINVKTFLPNYNEFYEKRWFSSAEDLMACEILSTDVCTRFEPYTVPVGNNIIYTIDNKYSFSAEICEDLWAPVTPSALLATGGAQMIFNLSASNDIIGKRDYRRNLIKSKSISLACEYIYVSAGAGESSTDLVFSGHSVFAENGRILNENNEIADDDYLLVQDVDISKVNADRLKGKSYKDCARAFGIDKDITEVKITSGFDMTSDAAFYRISKYPFIPSDMDKRLARCKDIFKMQVGGLVKRLSITGGKMVVGVSGGMDSTLTLLVCAQALKKLGRPMTDLVGITMPAFGTTDRTYNNSLKLMETLGISIKNISIKEACIVHYADIEHDFGEKNLTFENVQARERTQVLMDYANKIGAIVVGTGDLSELALGWCTYNADQMSMYGVNASIPKTLVKWLIDSVISHELFPESTEVLKDIIDTPISPELLPPDENGEISQKTEDSVGPYELHDFFMYYVIRYGFTPSKIYFMACRVFSDTYDKETILKWMKMFYKRFFSQQFKRSCMPDGVKVGSVCLSPRGDWRMPSDAAAGLWLRELEEL